MIGRSSVIILACAFLPQYAHAQKQILFTSGIEFNGDNYGYKFQQNGSVLQNGWTFPDGTHQTAIGLTFNLGLHYRVARKWALETGVTLSEIDMLLYDARYQQTHRVVQKPGNTYNSIQGKEGNFDFAHLYKATYFSLYFFPWGRSFYINAGAMINYNAQHTFDSWSTNSGDGQTLTVNAQFSPRYTAEFLEAGFFMQGTKQNAYKKQTVRPSYFLGLRYYHAGDMMDGNYQNSLNGKSLYGDHVSATGSYLALTFRVGIPATAIELSDNRASRHNRTIRKLSGDAKKSAVKKRNKKKAVKRRSRKNKKEAVPTDNTRGF